MGAAMQAVCAMHARLLAGCMVPVSSQGMHHDADRG
jgi:hypothetical protein